MEVGDNISEEFLVVSGALRYTKGNKPYLYMELSDGSNTIIGIDWDSGEVAPPKKNDVVRVKATVTEFAGNKQLKIESYSRVEGADISKFVPKDDSFSVEEYISLAKGLINDIENEELRSIVRNIYNDYPKLWTTLPAASGIHHAFVAGLLKHSVDVATKALAIASLTPNCSTDLVIAGALLHDMGKLWTYEFNGAVIEMTEQGQMIEHIAIGIAKMEQYRTEQNSRLVDLLQHIISSHHGRLEYGSPTVPLCLEAFIVSAADSIDAKTQIVLELNTNGGDEKYTEKSWALDNKRMFKQSYIKSLLEV